jgi:hypothetical protein
MAQYDIGISLSQGELETGSSAIWNKLHPQGKVFVGSGSIDFEGQMVAVDYDATEPPVFDLQPLSRSTILKTLKRAAGAANAGGEAEGLLALAADTASSFSITFPKFSFKFSIGGDATTLVTDVTVLCGVSITAGVVHFVALSASAPPQPTVGGEFILQNFILPQVESAAKNLFAGLRIPPLSLPGVTLTAPVLLVANRRLYAAACVAGQGRTPSLPPPGIPGPDASFFMALELAALQAVTSFAVGQSGSFNRSGESGDSGFNAHYLFSYQLVNPHVSLNGAELRIDFDLTGSIEAGVTVFWIPIGLGYQAVARPTPAANCRIVASGASLRVIEDSFVPFTLLVEPTGSIPTKVLSWMTEFIVFSIVAALTPLVTAFLKNIDFTTLNVPSFSESIAGVDVTMTPVELSVESAPNGITLLGRLQFS